MPMPELLEAGFDYNSGEALAAQLFMRKRDELPTAIAASSDQQAIGIMRGASDYGISIPAMFPSLASTIFRWLALPHHAFRQLCSLLKQ